MANERKRHVIRAPRSRERKSPELYSVPLTQASWDEYCRWHLVRGIPTPPMPRASVFIADKRGLICGACLYPTEGPYVFGEHLSTNPACSLRLRHRAVVALVRAIRSYCSSTSKYPVFVIRHKSLLHILAREGYVSMPGITMTAPQESVTT